MYVFSNPEMQLLLNVNIVAFVITGSAVGYLQVFSGVSQFGVAGRNVDFISRTKPAQCHIVTKIIS